MPRTRWNEIMFPWLSCPAWEARPGEFVIMVQEWRLYYHSMLKPPCQSKLLFNILFTPYFVFSLGFLSETWKLWEQAPTLFCLRLPNTYSGFVCPILLFAWLNAVPGKMYLWASVKSMTCLQHPWGSSEVSVSRLWHVSMCKCTLMPICLMPVGSIRS